MRAWARSPGQGGQVQTNTSPRGNTEDSNLDPIHLALEIEGSLAPFAPCQGRVSRVGSHSGAHGPGLRGSANFPRRVPGRRARGGGQLLGRGCGGLVTLSRDRRASPLALRFARALPAGGQRPRRRQRPAARPALPSRPVARHAPAPTPPRAPRARARPESPRRPRRGAGGLQPPPPPRLAADLSPMVQSDAAKSPPHAALAQEAAMELLENAAPAQVASQPASQPEGRGAHPCLGEPRGAGSAPRARALARRPEAPLHCSTLPGSPPLHPLHSPALPSWGLFSPPHPTTLSRSLLSLYALWGPLPHCSALVPPPHSILPCWSFPIPPALVGVSSPNTLPVLVHLPTP